MGATTSHSVSWKSLMLYTTSPGKESKFKIESLVSTECASFSYHYKIKKNIGQTIVSWKPSGCKKCLVLLHCVSGRLFILINEEFPNSLLGLMIFSCMKVPSIIPSIPYLLWYIWIGMNIISWTILGIPFGICQDKFIKLQFPSQKVRTSVI